MRERETEKESERAICQIYLLDNDALLSFMCEPAVLFMLNE